jgi:hypothetical protein
MKTRFYWPLSAFIATFAFLATQSGTAQIQVDSTNPSAAPQGTVNLNVTVSGSGFKKGAKAQWFVTGTTNPGGVTVNSTAFNGPSTLTANITIASDAAVSGFDVVVTNADGRTGKGTDLFAVQSNGNNCTDVPLQLIVAPQTSGQGGISGDGLSIYNNPNDPAFNGGTQYVDGVGGVYARFQVCNGTNDFILNLRSTKSPVRYLNLDFSVRLAPADTANGALDLTRKQIHQPGQQINEMANAALYSNGQFVTCSGMMLNPLSATVTGGNAWFKPTTIYDPVVADCNGGTGPDLANQGGETSPVQVQQVNACTWTVTPLLDSTGTWYRVGVAETVKTGGHTSTLVAGGQYQMPFSYKIQKLNCTP